MLRAGGLATRALPPMTVDSTPALAAHDPDDGTDGDPIVLSHQDQAAMPADLRTALLNWHRQHRAMEAGVSFQDAQVVPDRTTSDHLTRAMLHAVHGLLDRAHVQVWVDRFRMERDDPRRVNECTPLFEMAIEARRLDLLDALLSNPDLVPTHTSTNGGSSFNGGRLWARRRATNVEGPGPAFWDALARQWPALQQAKDPLVAAFSDRAQAEQLVHLEIQDAQKRQMLQIGLLSREAYEAYKKDPWAAREGHGQPAPTPAMRTMLQQAQGARYASKTNLVGLAVMHGWPDGVQRLLDAGVDPYAIVSTRRLCHSALVLASVFNEPACAVVLLKHSSFSTNARYGEADKDIARMGSSNVSALTLWHQIDPALMGGFDWNLLCRSALLDDPDVQAVMLKHWQGMTASRRERVTAHDLRAAQRWEQVVLRAAIEASTCSSEPERRTRNRL